MASRRPPRSGGAPHPAVIALFDARVGSVRQSVLPDGDGRSGTVEAAVTIA